MGRAWPPGVVGRRGRMSGPAGRGLHLRYWRIPAIEGQPARPGGHHVEAVRGRGRPRRPRPRGSRGRGRRQVARTAAKPDRAERLAASRALPTFPSSVLPWTLRNRRSRYALGRLRALRVAECLCGLRCHRLRRCLIVTHFALLLLMRNQCFPSRLCLERGVPFGRSRLVDVTGLTLAPRRPTPDPTSKSSPNTVSGGHANVSLLSVVQPTPRPRASVSPASWW